MLRSELYRCICWLIVEVILRNARSNDEIHGRARILLPIWAFVAFSRVNFNFTP